MSIDYVNHCGYYFQSYSLLIVFLESTDLDFDYQTSHFYIGNLLLSRSNHFAMKLLITSNLSRFFVWYGI